MQAVGQSSKKKLSSLRRRYLIVATIVAVLLMIGAVQTSSHMQKASNNNTVALELRVHANKALSTVRGALWQSDISMNTMLVTPLPEHEEKIIKNIELAGTEAKALLAHLKKNDSTLTEGVKKLNKDIDLFSDKMDFLLEKRKDSEWVYPILPYINDKLLVSNNEFENAGNIILHLIAEEDGRSYASERFGQFDELRDTWRYMILNFRMFLIRFAGLGNAASSPQEVNIEDAHEVIVEKLSELENLRQKGELSFDSEHALDTMQKASKTWYENWGLIKTFRKNNAWRNDTHTVGTEIRPLQQEILNSLSLLDNELLAMSGNNVTLIQENADEIGRELWLFFVLALLFVAGVYLMIDRSILRPIAMISNALSAEGQQIDYKLGKQDSKEINQLVTAFFSMRKQVHQRQEELQVQALHDALTGLPNRTLFTDRIEQAIKDMRRNDKHMSVLLLDLDRFKDINDVLGHPVGDKLLQHVAQRLGEMVRESDTVARLGGDEFAIVCPYTDRKQSIKFAKKIVNAINDVFTIESQNLYIGVSVGIAVYPEHGNDVSTLIRHADVAMYTAKRERLGLSIYKESQDKGNADHLVLVEALHSELEDTKFLSLNYQPQIDLFSREIKGVEALLRWQHPELGIISPENIVQIAEHSGQIDQLTDWVIRTAVKECSDIIETEKLLFSINLSAKNLQDTEMPARVSNLLQKHNISNSSLTLEITESAMMNDPVHSRETMNELSAMGINLSVDDYGTGFSSLGYLKLLPVNELKIDKSFVMNMLEDENDAIIVHSTIELAHNLGLKVVAEGVEDHATMMQLRNLKCDVAQGYFISRPMSRKKFHTWLNGYQPVAVTG